MTHLKGTPIGQVGIFLPRHLVQVILTPEQLAVVVSLSLNDQASGKIAARWGLPVGEVERVKAELNGLGVDTAGPMQ